MSFKVVGIGEVLWDLLPLGPQLGGAPMNFAFHSQQLGADVRVISRVGNDVLGERVFQCFREMGISGETVQVDEQLPTGTASISLDQSGTPRFIIQDQVAWDALALTEDALDSVRKADAVCFGTLAQRSTAAASVIQQLVAAVPINSLRVLDINLRQAFYSRETIERSLKVANVLKLNDHELNVLSPLFQLTGDMTQKIVQLADRFNLQLVALTRAERGSLLYRAGDWSELPARQTNIVDTVGAGDAFTAALVVGLLNHLGFEEIHCVAADVAGFVCSRSGATPALPLLLGPKKS